MLYILDLTVAPRASHAGMAARPTTLDGLRVGLLSSGIADYPFVVVPHPLGSLTDTELQQRAATAAQQARSILLGEE